MSIFLDINGASGTGFFNLLTVSGEDGGLGLDDVPGDPTVFQITYVETAGQPATADRLNQLVNNNFPSPVTTTNKIVVTPLNGGNDPHSGVDVTGNGITYIDTTGSSPVIRVAYDVSQCCGSGMFNLDTGGNHISVPNPVIVYHELSHAFRAVTGTSATNDEVPAETDENVLRGVLGLCMRDVNNHDGGCGSGDDCGGSAGNADGGPPAGGCASSGGGCFIVSATTGSPVSVEVMHLRQLRDQVAAASKLAAQLIETIYQEYYQFSPQIADNLQQDAAARNTVLGIVVRPLLAWYTLAGVLALKSHDDETVSQALQEVANACPQFLGSSLIPTLLEKIRDGEPLPVLAPKLLRQFAPRLQQIAQLRFASWAIFDPLIRVWRAATAAEQLITAVSEWLATAPLEALDPIENPELLETDLSSLASFFDFQPQARQQLGARLAVAWPDATAALQRHGFLYEKLRDN
jgi:hypothetical protein